MVAIQVAAKVIFSREDKPEDGSESSKNDRDSSVNESGQESLTDHAISQSWKPIPTRMQTEILKPIVVQSKIQCFQVFSFFFFYGRFDDDFYFATTK